MSYIFTFIVRITTKFSIFFWQVSFFNVKYYFGRRKTSVAKVWPFTPSNETIYCHHFHCQIKFYSVPLAAGWRKRSNRDGKYARKMSSLREFIASNSIGERLRFIMDTNYRAGILLLAAYMAIYKYICISIIFNVADSQQRNLAI